MKLNLYFTEDDTKNILKHHEDSLVIEIDIGHNNRVTKMMVDTESSVYILYISAYKRLGGKIEDLTSPKEPIYGFTNTAAPLVGRINLRLSIGSKKRRAIHTTKFVVVNLESSLNGIIGRSSIHGFKVFPSSYHQCMLYFVNVEVTTVYEQQLQSMQLYHRATRMMKPKENQMVWVIKEAPCFGLEKEDTSVDLIEEINIGGRVIKLGAKLSLELKEEIC